MTKRDVDLFVIGGGSGGVRAARIAAQHGARVAIAESDRWGGTCVIRGCIPKKLFVYASEYAHAFEDAASYGWTAGEPRFDWKTLLANKDAEIARLSGLYAANLERHGVETIAGHAALADAHTIAVGDRRISAEHILVASGGYPWLPPEGEGVAITSDDAFHLDELPGRMLVVGGGYIAVELAHIFAGFGVEVSLVHRRSLVLRGFDEDVRAVVTANLTRAGIATYLETVVESMSRGESGITAQLATGESLEVDQVLCAVGRRARTRGLGLEAVGVELEANGAIVVDDHSQTRVPHIYAVGDCTDRLNLTPVAIRDGHAVADSLFGGAQRAIDHHLVPTAVFCQPELGTVGMTEDEARDHAIDVEVFRAEFRPLKLTLTPRDEKVFMKLIVDRASDRVVGAHMVGHGAAEIVQTLAIAIKMGATRADFRRTTALHPTTAEEWVLL
jgi:glutathione reductase (NADPH)